MLLDILVIAVMAVICGADGGMRSAIGGAPRTSAAEAAHSSGGVPSADTYRRVFARISPSSFERAFRGWIGELIGDLTEHQIAIDGKTSRRGGAPFGVGPEPAPGPRPSVTKHLLLGQVATDAKSTEITAIPGAMALLDWRGPW
ncbi:MAG: ISAs1 family transposase [Polyangiales bacterium]